MPPAIILGYVGYMPVSGQTPWGGERVAAMEDAGPYPFGSASETRFVPPIPYFKAVFIDQSIFCVIVENVVLPPGTQDPMLLVLRWWAFPAEDTGVTSPSPRGSGTALDKAPAFSGSSPWWDKRHPLSGRGHEARRGGRGERCHPRTNRVASTATRRRRLEASFVLRRPSKNQLAVDRSLLDALKQDPDLSATGANSRSEASTGRASGTWVAQ